MSGTQVTDQLSWVQTVHSVHSVLQEFKWFSRDLNTELSLLDKKSKVSRVQF